jgi:hypothetical protein
MTSTSVNPFYDSGPAPPPIPLLSAQTPVIYTRHRASLVANEELRPSLPKSTTAALNSTSAPAKSRGSTPLPPKSRSARKTHRHSTPLQPPPSHADRASELQANSRGATPLEDDPARASSSELTEPSEHSEGSGDSDASAQRLIPRPPGGPGRPESGGYNLAVAMKLGTSAFKKLRVNTFSFQRGPN